MKAEKKPLIEEIPTSALQNNGNSNNNINNNSNGAQPNSNTTEIKSALEEQYAKEEDLLSRLISGVHVDMSEINDNQTHVGY